MSRCSQWQDHDASQPFSLSKALLDLVSTESGYPWRGLLRTHMGSHMDNICLLCGVGESSLIESLSQLCVMFSQLVFWTHAGKFIVELARHFLSFSPTRTTEVSPQTGGLVRNSTGEECFSKANPTEKKTSPLSVSSGFCPLLVWLVTSSVTISVVDVLSTRQDTAEPLMLSLLAVEKILLPAACTSSYKLLITIESHGKAHGC